MGTGLYKSIRGRQVEITAAEAKAFIMKQHGWTPEEYNKEYDMLRNRQRNLERFQRELGVQVERENVRNILYREARAMQRHGKNYQPSLAMERLREFTSASPGRKGKFSEQQRTIYAKATKSAFAGLIAKNPGAAAIAEKFKDNPAKMEKALAEFAKKWNVTKSPSGHYADLPFDVPIGQAIGSTDGTGFEDIIKKFE